MDKPTNKQLSDTKYVLEWLENYYRENEPYATNTIQALESIQIDIPDSMDDLEGNTE